MWQKQKEKANIPFQVYMDEVHDRTLGRTTLEMFYDDHGCLQPPSANQIEACMTEIRAEILLIMNRTVEAYRRFPFVIGITLLSLALWELVLKPDSGMLSSLLSGILALTVILGYYHIAMKGKAGVSKKKIESAAKIMTALSPVEEKVRFHLIDISNSNNEVKTFLNNISKEKRMITRYEAGELIKFSRKEKEC